MINNKKAFTLIELLAVIIILAIVALIATPIVLDVVDDARTSAAKSEAAMIVSGINNYCATAEMKAQMNNTTSICADGVTKEEVALMVDLGNAKVLEIEYGNISTGEVAMVASLGNARVADIAKKSGVTYLKVESNTKIVIYDGRTYKIDGEVVETPEPEEPVKVLYKDNSGANRPELLNNMIPVIYDEDNSTWVYADVYEKWYDYDEQMWANAVVLNNGITKSVGDPISVSEISLMYVWIPRYTYTIFNGNREGVPEQVIDVKFENGINSTGTVTCEAPANGRETCTDKNGDGSIVNGESTYTHPAFTFGEEKLTGFWMGKFEISGSVTQVTIKPNVTAMDTKQVGEFFEAIKTINSVYDIDGDSHMIKNMEWGAVAYLKQSQYGLGMTDISINNYGTSSTSNRGRTGCGDNVQTCVAYNTEDGKKASTTGNIYGVYDMSGGMHEYTTGTRYTSITAGDAGFTEVPELKYYETYAKPSSQSDHTIGKLGDATKETVTKFSNSGSGWYDDKASFFYNGGWIMRGGAKSDSTSAGVFHFEGFGSVASNVSTRAVLTP